jgi:exodeoxyribonuclease VII large subunit
LKFVAQEARFFGAFDASIYKKRANFSQTVAKINALNPLNILERGFAFVTQGEKVIKNANELEINSEIDIKFANGTAKAVIKSKEG